jgi:hypothetical protein
MGCPPQVFTSVTPEQLVRIMKKAAAAGLRLEGNAGQVSHAAFSVSWHFDPANNTFTIQCTEHPFLAPCTLINSRIHELVQSCRFEMTVKA